MWRKTGLMEGGEDAEFASRCSDSRSSHISVRSLARSIDGRNSNRVADSVDRYRRFSSSLRLTTTLARIAVAGRTGDPKERRARMVGSERRTVVLVRVAVLEIPRQSVELKARETNLSSFVLSIAFG